MKSLDNYSKFPSGMREYLDNYGFHFSKKALETAVKGMKRYNPATGKKERIEPYTKEQVETMLSQFGLTLERNKGYDFVFVANMAKADYRKSLPDDEHIAYYVKETIDDVDASDETTFRRWLATMVGNGEPIDWEDML